MFKIGKTIIGNSHPVYIVAEPGVNHKGDIELAKKLISEASKSGANAVKFQVIGSDEVYLKDNYPKYNKMIRDTQLSKNEYIELQKYAKMKNIDFFATPAGEKSLKILEDINVSAIKIGSGELNRTSLIEKASEAKKPLIVSTGMTTISEISSIVELLKKKQCSFALLHCNSCYPTPIEDANLSTIPYLANVFKIPIGYSDHTIGNIACLSAVSVGASIIEKHFSIDDGVWKQEIDLSAHPKEFSEMVKQIRTIEKMLGKPRQNVSPSEIKSRRIMRYSICASCEIKPGTKIKNSMLTILRPGTGIQPNMKEKIIGLTINKKIKKGTPLEWKMFK